MLVFRKSTPADLEAMVQIASDGKAFLKRCGVSQWQKGAIDTHPDNKAMQRALEKAGFVRCGNLVLVSGAEKGDGRLGYERVLVARSLEGKS